MNYVMGLMNVLGGNAAVQTLVGALNSLLAPALIIVATAGALYSVWLGVKLAKAEEEESAKKAKKHLITVVTAVVVVVALIIVFYWVADSIEEWLDAARGAL